MFKKKKKGIRKVRNYRSVRRAGNELNRKSRDLIERSNYNNIRVYNLVQIQSSNFNVLDSDFFFFFGCFFVCVCVCGQRKRTKRGLTDRLHSIRLYDFFIRVFFFFFFIEIENTMRVVYRRMRSDVEILSRTLARELLKQIYVKSSAWPAKLCPTDYAICHNFPVSINVRLKKNKKKKNTT